MDPQQELFTAVRQMLVGLFGEDSVHDGMLPPEGTPYPFVYLGDTVQDDTPNKSAVFGRVSLTIHVWHNDPHQRGTVSEMLLQIKTVLRGIEHTKNFGWMVDGINQQILPDNTTTQPLLHGIVQSGHKFS